MIPLEDHISITRPDGTRETSTMALMLDADEDRGALPGTLDEKLATIDPAHVTLRITLPGREPEDVSVGEMMERKSVRMWMHMISTRWDRRKLKRIMRLAGEGR